jgi:hypothetical protein
LGDDHHRFAIEKGGAADQGAVVVELAVAVELLETGADRLDVIEGVGALGVAGDLDFLPRREGGLNFALGGADFLFDGVDFAGEVHVGLDGLLAQFIELLGEFAERFLKL